MLKQLSEYKTLRSREIEKNRLKIKKKLFSTAMNLIKENLASWLMQNFGLVTLSYLIIGN